MLTIRSWAQQAFGGNEPTLIIEVGAHKGEDTQWLASLPNSRVHAFEPAPANPKPERLPPNVTWHPVAVANRCGFAAFLPSTTCRGKPYTKSGSLRRPTGHLVAHPDVAFGWPVDVQVTMLDAFAEQWLLADDVVDLVWCDCQGSERDVILGGLETFERTRWAYLEVPGEIEEYEGQATLEELLDLLPGWSIEHRWPYDVLLKGPSA